MKKKNILITTDCFLPRWDGVTRFLTEVIPHLVKEYNITILAPQFTGELDNKKYPWISEIALHRFPLFPLQVGDIHFSNVKFSEIKQYVEHADLIFNQTLGPIGLFTIAAAQKSGKEIISYVHSLEWELATKSVKRFKFLVHFFGKRFVACQYNKCSFLFVPTTEVLEKLSLLGVKTQMEVVPLGVNTAVFTAARSKAKAKQFLQIPTDAFVVGFIGRLGREKDLPTLYRAFRRLERSCQNVLLLIVGVGVRDVEVLFQSEKHIISVGKQDNVIPYLQAMDVYVLPSLTETTSLSTLEAMSCEIPVVCTPVGYVKEYVQEKVNGMLFPFRNNLILSSKMELLYQDTKLRRALGKAARKTVEQDFQLSKTITTLKKLLKQHCS